MNLTLETALHGIAATLRDRITPALNDPFAIESARLATMLLTVAANGVDDLAAIRVWENAAIRSLLADLADAAPAPLSGTLVEASNSADPGLRISELDRENGRLRTLLVQLHAAIEDRPDEAAARSNGASGRCCARSKRFARHAGKRNIERGGLNRPHRIQPAGSISSPVI